MMRSVAKPKKLCTHISPAMDPMYVDDGPRSVLRHDWGYGFAHTENGESVRLENLLHSLDGYFHDGS